MKKQTIADSIKLSGIGLHTGKIINLNLIPAESGGIRFTRTDLVPNITIHADANAVSQTTRNTTIAKGEVSVSTIEHLMAALSGKGIDNLIIELDGPEIPILDGSSIHFIKILIII